MEATEKAIKEEKTTSATPKPKKNKGFWSAFYNFLACGGFMLILFLFVGIVVLISVLTK